MKRHALFLMASLLTQNISPAFAAPPPPSQIDYWRDSGIQIKDFEDHALPHCYDSAAYLMGCVNALNLMGSAAVPPVYYTTEEEKAANPELGALKLKSKNGLNVYLIQKVELKNKLEAWSMERAVNAAHLKAVNALFEKTKSGAEKISFLNLIEQMKSNILVGDYKDAEPLFAGLMFNSFLGSVTDPHTWLKPKKMLEEEIDNTTRRFVGIGASLMQTEQGTLIAQVVEGSPAMKAGLKSKDIIIEVTEDLPGAVSFQTPGKTLSEVIVKIKGEENSSVRLKVKRKDQITEYRLQRAKLVDPNVSHKLVTENGTPYGYIRIKSFMDPKTAEDVKAAMWIMKFQEVKGWILDLRGNGGGLLGQAVELSSIFTGTKRVLFVKDLTSNQSYGYNGRRAAETDLPMVTLIDAGSASASEITAGALQDHHRSWILGQRSYGKATVQAPANASFDNPYGYFQFGKYQNDKIVLYQTIQRFYQPTGRTNQVQGILPNFEVDPFPGAKPEDMVAYREEDLYTNAFSALGPKWTEDRMNEVKAINQCRKSKGKADALYQSISDSEPVNAPDYQLLAAEDVLSCAALTYSN